VQYRGEILRLVDLASTLGSGYNSASSDTMHVVVYHHSDVRVGIIVDEVIDIVDEHVPHGRTSLVVDGRVTELVDMAGIAANALGMPDLSYIDFDTAFVQHAPELALAGSNGNGAH